MKRNNLLMGAYIAFVFLCFIIRAFDEYPMWNAIVAAVTFSSAFFAYADFFIGYSKSLSDTCDIANEFICTTKKRLSAETKSFEEINAKMDSIPKEKFDFSELREVIIPIQKEHDDMELWMEEYADNIKEKRKKAQNNKFIAEVLTFLGFLIFLCILVFLPITDAVVEAQDILSVLSFAVILLSNLCGTIQEEKLEKDRSDSQRAKKRYEECRDKLKEMRELISRLVKEIEATEEYGGNAC